jgi:3-oxoacyl-[acyl-carrier-protein] synthase II
VSPPIPGLDSPFVHPCWTLADARNILALARPGARVLQMGAGFIGCIILEALAQRGVKLTVVEMGDRMGPRMMGEGAGVLLLETEEHALKRGAKIYCELAGYAANCDAFHITAPHPEGEGMSDCLQMAVESAGIKLTDVQYVNAHGTSTPLNDKFETMAYKRVFGDHAHKLKISSTKCALGHLLGAAGSVEAAICCKVIETGSMPPTLNYKTPDPECDLDYIPNVKFVSDKPVEVAISDNLGFGGHNAALVFKRYQKA